MEKDKRIPHLLKINDARYELLEQDLFLFGLYYFTESFTAPSAFFHKEWCKAFQGNEHLLIIAFRESAKTLWVMIKWIHNICYSKKRFMMYYCFDASKSAWRLYDIAIHLQTNKKIQEDFWILFPGSVKNAEQESQKKSLGNFITTNWIQCKAMSIGQSPRWEMFFHRTWTYRPDFVVLDDIDIDRSVSNVNIIEKNYRWIKWELLWGLSWNCQIVFLGNIIKNDWIVLRFEIDYRNSKNWKIFRKALIEDWICTWPERYSDEDIADKRAMLGEISFNQNMLLLPYSWGDSIIKRSDILYRTYTEWDKIVIWVDPAISEKEMSDDFAIVVTAFIGKHKNVKACYALKWAEKNPLRAVQFIKSLYTLWKAKVVNVETVAFQKVLADLLKQEWIAVKSFTPTRDKVTRLMEKQADIEQWNVSFEPEGEWIKVLIDELISFPNVIHDDRVDAFIYSLEDKVISVFVGSF